MEIDKNRMYSPKEVIAVNGGALPISLSAVYAAIERGELKTKRIGTRLMIPGRWLLEFLGEE